jgi:AraC family transcriptional regulator
MTDFASINLGEIPSVPFAVLPPMPGAEVGTTAGMLFAEARPLFRGGLPPGVLRSVCQFVETHLERTISLEELASIARLSISHFARAFKQSKGVSPHNYLLRRRVQRAQELLAGTELPLSEIAFACGFADQSHCSRQFKERVGVSPRRYRWLMR